MYKKNNYFLWVLLLTGFMSTSAAAQSLSRAREVAAQYIRTQMNEWGLVEADIAEMSFVEEQVLRHNGTSVVYFNQRKNGIDVFQAQVHVVVSKGGQVLYAKSQFVPNLAVNASTPALKANEALSLAAEKLGVSASRAFVLKEAASNNRFVFHDATDNLATNVQLVYRQDESKRVRLAWDVLLYDQTHTWSVRVDALNGELIEKFDLTAYCSFDRHEYTGGVSRKPLGQPEAGLPRANSWANYSNQPNAGGSYRVLPLPNESPNHGSVALEVNPEDATASPYGWHDTNGQDGAEYTKTRGNNVWAYQDANADNNSSNDEPDGTASLLFDFPVNFANEPAQYIPAATVNLFYVANKVHDILYHYGFDEASKNYQINNYGNGGTGNDNVRCEAQDGSGVNNANFAPSADGSYGRLQMYLWDESVAVQSLLTVNTPASVSGQYASTAAQFGAAIPVAPLTADLVWATDGGTITTDACQAITNGSALAGKIALVDRGDCEFGFKCKAVQDRGAIAAIICNNVPGALVAMGPGAVGSQVTIPCIFISYEDCQLIRNAGTPLNGTIKDVETNGPTMLDGDFDNVIVAHEYGHGVSNRLTGSSGVGCLIYDEQMGEGWSDFIGMMLTTKPTDTGAQKRGVGTYVQREATSGLGIRPFPYSTDMVINPMTYDNIKSAAVPHGVGSVWCTMLWDLYWAMIDEYGFDPDIYHGTGGNNKAIQLMMDGLKLQGCHPGFVDGRNAILLADDINNGGANKCLIWKVFARRGLGFSASQGNSTSRGDGTQAFDELPECVRTLKITKTATPTVLGGETITYTFQVENNTGVTQTNVIIRDTFSNATTYVAGSAQCGGTVNGNILVMNLGDIPSGQARTCTFQVRTATSPATSSMYLDNMENNGANWLSNIVTTTNSPNTNKWTVSNTGHSGTVSWHVENIDTLGQTEIVLSEPILVQGVKPALRFWHKYNTEPPYDGGVVQIIGDQTDYTDLGPFILKNGYDGYLNNGGPLGNARKAFWGYSDWKETIVDISAFQGQYVFVRFLFATDGGIGVDQGGWWVDDFELIDLITVPNTACITSNEGQTSCSEAPNFGTVVLAANTSSTSNAANNTLSFQLFPNPTSGSVNMTIPQVVRGEATITVTNISGQQVYQQSYNNPQSTLPLQLKHLPAGVYMVQLRTNEGFATQKLTIQ